MYTGDKIAFNVHVYHETKCSMLFATLRKHRDTNHPACKDKDINFFQLNCEIFMNCRSLIMKTNLLN